jgi:hypothetical protein
MWMNRYGRYIGQYMVLYAHVLMHVSAMICVPLLLFVTIVYLVPCTPSNAFICAHLFMHLIYCVCHLSPSLYCFMWWR